MTFDWIALMFAGIAGVMALASFNRWRAGDMVGMWCCLFMVVGVIYTILRDPL